MTMTRKELAQRAAENRLRVLQQRANEVECQRAEAIHRSDVKRCVRLNAEKQTLAEVIKKQQAIVSAYRLIGKKQ